MIALAMLAGLRPEGWAPPAPVGPRAPTRAPRPPRTRRVYPREAARRERERMMIALHAAGRDVHEIAALVGYARASDALRMIRRYAKRVPS